jgi:hypothetical protein
MPNMIEKTCIGCKNIFIVDKYRASRRSYCTPACFRKTTRYAAAIDKKCHRCGKVFSAKSFVYSQNFCSNNCKEKHKVKKEFNNFMYSLYESR